MVLLVAALAIAGYSALAAYADWHSVRKAVSSISAELVLTVLTLSALNYGLRYARWRILLHALGHHVPESRNIAYYLAGFAFTATPGKAGEAVRSVYLLPHGVTMTESIGTLIMDRLFDLLAIGLLSVFLVVEWRIATAIAVVGCAACGLLGLPSTRGLGRKVYRATKGLCPACVRVKLHRLSSVHRVINRLGQPRLLVMGTTLGFAAWLAEGYGLYILVEGLSSTITVADALGIYALSILIGVASFLPGGLGSTEASMGFLLTRHGLSPDNAIAATVLCRLATLWFAVALGVLAVLWIATRRTPVVAPAP